MRRLGDLSASARHVKGVAAFALGSFETMSNQHLALRFCSHVAAFLAMWHLMQPGGSSFAAVLRCPGRVRLSFHRSFGIRALGGCVNHAISAI